MTDRTYDYRDRNDLKQLALICMDMPYKSIISLLATVFSIPLMNPDWIAKQAIKLLKWSRKKQGLSADQYDVYVFLFEHNEKNTIHYFNQMIHHMLNGKDYSTSDAAGGFNQHELDILVECIDMFR